MWCRGDDARETNGGAMVDDVGADDSHLLDFVVLRCRRSIIIAQGVLPRIWIGIPSHHSEIA